MATPVRSPGCSAARRWPRASPTSNTAPARRRAAPTPRPRRSGCWACGRTPGAGASIWAGRRATRLTLREIERGRPCRPFRFGAAASGRRDLRIECRRLNGTGQPCLTRSRPTMCGSITKRSGQGTPILFVHEFAGDHRSWEPQLREFGKRYRCIAYAARGYTPSDVPADANAYSYKHVMRDAVAVLDHLKIDRAHIVGLSMGGYTTLQVALNHPSRVRSMTLAGTGSGSERWYTAAFHKSSRELARRVRARRLGGGGQDLRQRPEPRAVRDQGCARLCGISEASGRARRARLGPYLARFPGRAALAVRFRERDSETDDAGADRGRRRGRPLHRAEPVPEIGDRRLRAGHVSEDRSCGEPGGARFVQPGGRRFPRPRRCRPLAAARSALDCPTNRRRCHGTGTPANLFKPGETKRGSRRC